MDAICLVVAGVLRATLPASAFELDWQHSVEKIRWSERYEIAGDRLLLATARVEGSGAGMEAPPGAVFRDGMWTWHPQLGIAELRLTRSGFTQDYRLCWQRECRTLGDLVGPTEDGTVVVVRPCRSDASR
jgi:hypothetical protein